MGTRRWFHPHILGKEAEDLLLAKGQDGSFLVRQSQSTPGDFTLSVRRSKEITHVKIQSTEEFFDLYGGEKFATLAELIEYYTENPNALKEKNGQIIHLKAPLYTQEVTNERWYHGTVSGKEAEVLLSKSLPGSFLVRASVHSPGDFVFSVKVDDNQTTHIKINNTNGQFDVGGGKKFQSLETLVEHFKQAPMVEATGNVVRLKQAVNATRVISSNIHKRIEELQKTHSESYGKAGFWEEFEQLQQQDSKTLFDRKEGAKPENKRKNRYKNILPFDHTRVMLKDSDPRVLGSDYINANYIKDNYGQVKYIAAQGCVPDTVNDFWRMVYQENTRVIVMTTNEMERGRMKCQRYWPGVQTEMRFGQFLVQTVSEERKPHYILRELLLQKAPQLSDVPEEEEKEEFDNEEETKETKKSDEESKSKDKEVEEEEEEEMEEPRSVYHYHFTAWPDHGVPQDPAKVLEFLDDVNRKQQELQELELDPGPVLVHCSAGIGRTGTFIVIDLLLNQIEKDSLESEINIQKTILTLRDQRSGMVQTEAQYKFIYMAVANHIQSLQARSRVGDNYDNRSYPRVTSSSSAKQATPKQTTPTAVSIATPPQPEVKEHLYTNLEFPAKQNGGHDLLPPLPAK